MTEDSIDKFLFVALGWLLGLLAPVIVDSIKRKRDEILGKSAIHAELRDVSHKLAIAAHHVLERRSLIDRTHLEWVRQHLEEYPSLTDTGDILAFVRLQLSWTDDQIKTYAYSTASKQGKGLTLQKYPIPLLDSRVAAIWSFRTTVQRKLLAIRTNIELLNDIVDRSRKYSDMTFSKIEGESYNRLVENIEQCYDLYAERAKLVVNQVREFGCLM